MKLNSFGPNNLKGREEFFKIINNKILKILVLVILGCYFTLFSIIKNTIRKFKEDNNEIIIKIKKTKIKKSLRPLKIGVISIYHENNIGNTLIKISISSFLKSLGFKPYIVGKRLFGDQYNLTFLNLSTNLVIINNFNEIKQNDYDILMVNSDQTWRPFYYFEDGYNDFLNVGFLKFAENWNIRKFVYAASLGFNKFDIKENDIEMVRNLLKKFSGISVREKNSIPIIKKLLNINAYFVLDPTMLYGKDFYLNLIKNYFNENIPNKKILFAYSQGAINLTDFIGQIKINLNYDSNIVKLTDKDCLFKFIHGINSSDAVLTDSYHGTVFSIIFNKPFLSLSFGKGTDDRFNSLSDTFDFGKRIIYYEYGERLTDEMIALLKTPPNINKTIFNNLRNYSIEYLKKNLGIGQYKKT